MLNLTTATHFILRNYIQVNLSNSDSLFKSQVLTRVAYLSLAFLNIITGSVNATAGVLTGSLNILTAGKKHSLHKITLAQLCNTRLTLSLFYLNGLRVLNPHARLCNYIPKNSLELSFDGNGLFAGRVNTLIQDLSAQCNTSKNFLKKQVISRLTYVLLAVASLVTRAVDAVIGIIAAVFSILTLGKFNTINTIAFRGLQVPGIVDDLFYCAVKIINPWTGVN